MIIEIKHRWTGAVLWSGEAESVRDAVARAVSARAYLAGANLAGADLAGADRLLRTIDAGPGSPPEGGFDAPPGAKAFTPRGEAETDTTTEGDET